MRYVYVFRLGDFHKIGQAADPKGRLYVYATLPYPGELVHVIPSGDARAVERALHWRFRPQRKRGEWFSLTPEDVALLRSVARADDPADLPAGLLSPGLPPPTGIPPEEHIVRRVNRVVRAAAVKLAAETGRSIGEVVNDALVAMLGLDPALHPHPMSRRTYFHNTARMLRRKSLGKN